MIMRHGNWLWQESRPPTLTSRPAKSRGPPQRLRPLQGEGSACPGAPGPRRPLLVHLGSRARVGWGSGSSSSSSCWQEVGRAVGGERVGGMGGGRRTSSRALRWRSPTQGRGLLALRPGRARMCCTCRCADK
jgi:hypothetical protein